MQDWLNDDSATLLTKIKQMINAAYKKLLAQLPTYWAEKTGTFSLTTNAVVADLPSDCIRLIDVDYPSGNTDKFKPTVVTMEDWGTFRQPVDEIGQPEIFYPGGYTSTGGAQYMQLRNYPGCGVTYTGTYRARYYALPADMSADGDVPVFDDRWQDLLQQECRVQALLYDKKMNEAATLTQSIQQQMRFYLGREDSAEHKEAKRGK
jgi:hypothetical protein